MPHFDWFHKWDCYNPHKTAFKEYETGRSFTWQQVNRIANATARYFSEVIGLKNGARIAVLAENSLTYVSLLAVAQKAGFTLVPLNYRLKPGELDFMLTNSQPELVLWEDKFSASLQKAPAFEGIPHKKSMQELESWHEALLQQDAPVAPFSLPFDENRPVFLIYTAGTTAFPKGAAYTHKMLFWNSINTELRLDITSKDRALNCAPPFHTGSWNVLMAPFILHGAYTLLMRSFDPDAVLTQLEKDQHTIFWGVPTMLKMMAASPQFHQADLSRVRYFVIGGEAMPIPLIKTWHEKGVPVRQGYGLTEVGPNVTSLDHSDAIRKQGSIGTPNFFYEVKVQKENGEEAGDNEIGEFLLKGPAVTPGYWNNEAATRNAIKDGWFHTGDLVRRDREGFYYVVDRIKNMYVSGGENVYPAEVEHQIRQLEGVADVAIVGVPHEKWGETGKAFVVLKNGYALNEADIINYCRAHLAKYKTPACVEFLDALPVNNAGKIDRKALRKKEQ